MEERYPPTAQMQRDEKLHIFQSIFDANPKVKFIWKKTETRSLKGHRKEETSPHLQKTKSHRERLHGSTATPGNAKKGLLLAKPAQSAALSQGMGTEKEGCLFTALCISL